MRKQYKKYMTCMLLVLCVCLCAGCGYQFEIGEMEDAYISADEELIVVGVSQVGSESVWRTANTASIQKVFTKENGYFLIFDNARQKQENQIKAIRSFISQQVDYIVFSPITEYGWDTVLQEAKEAEIPVILMDRQVCVEDTSLYTAWVGSDFCEEGEKAGRWLEEYLIQQGREEETISIVVLEGTEGASAVIGRNQGFQNISSQHDNWLMLEQINGEYTTTKGKEVMEKMLRKYEEIDVVVSQNDDMTFGALEAIAQAGKTTGENGDMIVISFDAVEAALELVEKGILNVDIECNPNQASYIEQVIQKIENGETVAKAYYVPEQVFTRENAAKQQETLASE